MSVRSVLLAASLLSGFWTASRAQDYAYVANSRDHTVSVISTATNTILSTIQVGAIPEGVAVMPDGSRAYVTNFDDGTVSVIDAKTSSVVATIAVGNDALYPAITPDGSKLYVTQDGPVAVISTATNTVLATIPSITAIAVAVAPDGSKVYFANNNDVSVVDTATNAVLTTIPVGLAPFDLAVTPDGTRIYVVNFSSDTVSVIGTATNTVLATIQGLDQPANVAITPDGRTVYVTNQGGSDTVSVISTATNQIIATIPVGDLPAGVAVTRDGTLAYVPVHNENDVAVIGTATNKVVATIAVGGLPGALGKFIGPSPAAPPAAALSTLENLFVVQQQYFVFDSESSSNPQLNHLHITQLNTTTGAFSGNIFAPTVPPFIVPQQTLPVTGTITVTPDVLNAGQSFETADFYQIAFSWSFAEAALSCQTETASYTGAITFLGYEGSGKMHATIAGTVLANTGGCATSGVHLGPVPFSGQLTK
jgi:YVTN family beta-propeller protein